MNAQDFYDIWDAYELVDQASKGFTRDSVVGRTDVYGATSDYTPSSVVRMIRQDEMVSACITTKVDATVAQGDFIEASDNGRNKAAADKLFRENNWEQLRRQILWNLYAYGNCFLELVRNGARKVVELHVLETTEMEIVDEEGHGVPNQYIQRPRRATTSKMTGSQRNIVEFPPEDIVHFRLDRLTTSLWAEIPVRPLDMYVATKIRAKQHFHTQYKQNLFRNSFMFPEGSDEDDVRKSVAFLKEALEDPNKPLVMYGGISSENFTTAQDFAAHLDLINKIDSAILSQLQVPPIMAGLPDNSGRASGEQETYKAFNTHIRGVQRLFESVMNDVLLPRLGFTGITYKFGELDRKSEKDVVEMMIQLKALGAKPDKLAKFARDNGMNLDDDFFNEAFYEAPSKADNDAMTNQTAPSRANLEEGEGDNNVGTGSESTTREDQLVTQAFERLKNESLKHRAGEVYARFN